MVTQALKLVVIYRYVAHVQQAWINNCKVLAYGPCSRFSFSILSLGF